MMLENWSYSFGAACKSAAQAKEEGTAGVSGRQTVPPLEEKPLAWPAQRNNLALLGEAGNKD